MSKGHRLNVLAKHILQPNTTKYTTKPDSLTLYPFVSNVEMANDI